MLIFKSPQKPDQMATLYTLWKPGHLNWHISSAKKLSNRTLNTWNLIRPECCRSTCNTRCQLPTISGRHWHLKLVECCEQIV
jgi:hypothetical protein